jgi:formylmethanofuran dehydrogenase subunit E
LKVNGEVEKANMRPVIPVVSFVGNSASGKTTLIEEVVRELKRRGYRVAVIKHSPHGFEMDIPGKDTWRFSQAGSDVVAISSPRKLALIEQVDREVSLPEIETIIGSKTDIVITEGYKNSNTAKIVVLANEGDRHLLSCKGDILTTVSPHQSSFGVLQFDYDDIVNIVNLLIMLISGSSDHKLGSSSKGEAPTSGYSAYQNDKFEKLLAESAEHHGHICPGQVLGVRMAMRGCQELGIERPKDEYKRMVVYVEIDRCATDAIQVVTGCKLGKRTMRYVDYGKLAATFIDLHTGHSVRIVAREDAREKATLWYRSEWTKHEAEAEAYKVLPDEALFNVELVQVQIPVEDMPGPPQSRVICEECGEGINDSREVSSGQMVLCRACAFGSYYDISKEVVSRGIKTA